MIFCGSTARFVSDLVGNPEDRFSHNEAQITTKIIFDNLFTDCMFIQYQYRKDDNLMIFNFQDPKF